MEKTREASSHSQSDRARHLAVAVAVILSAFGCGGDGSREAPRPIGTLEAKTVYIRDPGVYEPPAVSIRRNVDQIKWVNETSSTWIVRFASHSPFTSAEFTIPAGESHLSGTSNHGVANPACGMAAHAYAYAEDPSLPSGVFPDSSAGPGVWVE